MNPFYASSPVNGKKGRRFTSSEEDIYKLLDMCQVLKLAMHIIEAFKRLF
jgi:hypothetical protein